MKLFSKDPVFYKKVFALALPIAVQSLVTTGVNMLDTVMVTKLGQNSLSAVSLANSFIGVYQIFCMGLGMGASVLVSRYWGMKKKNPDDKAATTALKQTISLMIRLTILLASLFAIATIIMPDVIMSMYVDSDMEATEEIISLGCDYFRWSVVTYFFLGLSLTCTIVLRSVGQAMMPLFVSGGALIINLGANYIFIFGKFGAPKMGVAGAALGTLIARVFETTVILFYLLVIDKKICFRIKDIFMRTRSLIVEYLKTCIPVLISDGILAIGNNTVVMVIGNLGSDFVSANAITSVTQQLSNVVISGVCQAGAIVTGQTLGLGKKEDTQRQGWLFLGLGFLLGAVSAAFIFGFSDMIINGYNSDGQLNAATVEIAQQLMLAISVIVIFQGTNSIMTKGVLRGGGDTRMLMFTDNGFLWVISIPLGILASNVFGWSAIWVYICLKSDQIIKTVWCIFRLKSGKWIKKISTGKFQNDGKAAAKA